MIDKRAQAIEELYRRRYGRFRNALATITGSREAAHDVVQEAFARALRSRASFRGDGSLEAWVWKIALRTAFELRPEQELVSLNGSLDPQLPAPERDASLSEALRALPARRRLFVFLRYFGELSYGEIAQVCGVSEGTVGAALTQARSQLAEALRAQEAAHGS